MPDEKLIAEQTHIRCKIIIEILGKPREHVEETLRKYIDKIKNVFYDIYSTEINNMLFKSLCYTAKIYAYFCQDEKLDDTKYVYKCVYNNEI